MDKGKGLDVSGIEDEFVRNKTVELFDNLVMQVRKRSDGTYVRRNDRSDVSVMSFVAPILEESPEYLERFRNSWKECPGDKGQSEKEEMKREISTHASIGKGMEDEEKKTEPHTFSQEEEEFGVSEQDSEGNKRGIGPQLPTADQFRQAAEIMDSIERGGENGEESNGEAFFIGPVPPEFEEEDLEGTFHFCLSEIVSLFVSFCMLTTPAMKEALVADRRIVFISQPVSPHSYSFYR